MDDAESTKSTPPEEFGRAALFFLFLLGVLGMLAPFFAAEVEPGRAEAISWLWRGFLVGSPIGVVGAVRRMRRMQGGVPHRRLGWVDSSIGTLGILGYVIATQSSPPLLGFISGMVAGTTLAFLLVYLPYWRANRSG